MCFAAGTGGLTNARLESSIKEFVHNPLSITLLLLFFPGHLDIVMLLLQHGADTTNAPTADMHGFTALYTAAQGE